MACNVLPNALRVNYISRDGVHFAKERFMDSQIVRCPNCGQANRVPPVGSGQTAVCGKCKTPLTAAGNGGHPIKLTDATFAN